MNNFSLYMLLILLFLGLSKSFSPIAQKTTFIKNKRVLSNISENAPISLILIDAFEAGLLIKTYYLRFKLVHGFKTPEFFIVRTNQKYFKENEKNIGMSLFRRYERNNKESTVPLPAGSIYVGDPAFGGWRYANSGERKWHFHNAYRSFPKKFYWKEYRPNYEFFKKVQIHLKSEMPFYGLNNEFGKEGKIGKELYEESPFRKKNKLLSFWEQLKELIFIPEWKKNFVPPSK